MSSERIVQHAFGVTADLFRALGLTQGTAAQRLGLANNTLFSFWVTGTRQFKPTYARSLYRLVVEAVNTNWPTDSERQIGVTNLLRDVIRAWEDAAAAWRTEAKTTLDSLRQEAKRLERFGDTQGFAYAQELHHLGQEAAEVSENLRHIEDFEAAWQRGYEEIHTALLRAEGKIEPTHPTAPRTPQRKRARKAKERA